MHRASWGNMAGRLLLLLSSSSMLFSRVNGDVSFDGSIPTNIEMGTSYTVEWSTDADSVRVTMVSGSEASDNIYYLYDIICDIWVVDNLSLACNSTDTSVDWTPADDLPVGHYMLMATAADASTAFSNQFNLAKAGSESSSQSTATSTTAAGSTGSTATSASTSASTPTLGSSSTTSTITSVPGSSETSSVPSDTASGGLSTGAKAGIGIGAAIGGLGLLGGLGFLIFRMGKRAADDKKKVNDEAAESGAADGKSGDSKPEESQPGSADAAAAQAGKAEDGGVAELQAPEKVHEAPDYKTRLDAPGKREFVSELDATGGLFVIPQTSRPNTGDTGALENADKDQDKENAAPAGKGEGESVKKGDEAAASESKDRASTSSGKPKSVIYETPDDIGRPEDK